MAPAQRSPGSSMRSRHRPGRALGLVVVLGQLTAACASTTTQTSTGGALPEPAAPVAASPLTAPTTPFEQAPAGGTSPVAGAASTNPAGMPTDASAPPELEDPDPGRVTPSPGVAGISGPGITDDTITIGLPWPRDVSDMMDGEEHPVTGLVGTPVDTPRAMRIVIDDMNAGGGILGREVRLHIWRYDYSNYPRLADYIAAECAYFTQDVEVFSVFIQGGDLETLDCYRRAGMPLIGDWSSILDEVEYQRNPNVFWLSFPNLSRYARLMVNGLADAGFLTPGSRIGVVSIDHPPFRRAFNDVFKPALAARGLSLTAEAHVTTPRDAEQFGIMATEINSAVLRFRAEGVEKVVFFDINAAVALLFLRAAEQQQYRGFQYGLTSGSGGDLRDESGERFFPAEQLRGAVLVGWAPLGDIPQAQGFDLLPPTADRCRDLLARHGMRFDPDTCCDLWDALVACNRLWFLEAALEAGPSGPINVTSFIRGGESLGTSFESADSFGATFGPGKHDGPTVYRNARWFPDCPCFRYTSGTLPMP